MKSSFLYGIVYRLYAAAAATTSRCTWRTQNYTRCHTRSSISSIWTETECLLLVSLNIESSARFCPHPQPRIPARTPPPPPRPATTPYDPIRDACRAAVLYTAGRLCGAAVLLLLLSCELAASGSEWRASTCSCSAPQTIRRLRRPQTTDVGALAKNASEHSAMTL